MISRTALIGGIEVKITKKLMEHSVKVCSINFFVSVRTLTVLAIKVISVKRVI